MHCLALATLLLATGAELAGPEGLTRTVFTKRSFFGSQNRARPTECFKAFPAGPFLVLADGVPPQGPSMGFFSRLFKIREQDPTSPDTTWAMEDNGSELVLDAEYASMLMTEIDIDAAIGLGSNIGDKQARIAGYNFAGPVLDNSVLGFYTDPRTFSLTVGYRF